MKLRLWFVPPLLGIAAYFAAGGVVNPRSRGDLETNAAKKEHGTALRSDVAAALGELEQEWASLQKEAGGKDSSLSPAGLRDKIVALKKAREALPEDTDWDTCQDFDQRLVAAASELGKRQGAEAVAWIDTIDPELRAAVMDGWADANPDAVFEAVVASKRLGPCGTDTLMRLLHGKATDGNVALVEACRQVPWELFLEMPGDPFAEGPLNLFEDVDIKPWIDSGAARELAEQGVSIRNLFSRWAQEDASQAMEAAIEWPRTSDSEIVQVLGAGLKDQGRGDELRAFLASLPPERFAQVAAAVTKCCERPSQFGENLASTYPMLISHDGGKEEE